MQAITLSTLQNKIRSFASQYPTFNLTLWGDPQSKERAHNCVVLQRGSVRQRYDLRLDIRDTVNLSLFVAKHFLKKASDLQIESVRTAIAARSPIVCRIMQGECLKAHYPGNESKSYLHVRNVRKKT